MGQTLFSLGFMSGTSLDGVDASLVQSDGEAHVVSLHSEFLAYPEAVRNLLRAATDDFQTTGHSSLASQASTVLTRYHLEAANRLLDVTKIRPEVVGFHGQTVLHRPDQRISLQLGEPHMLASALNCPVVYQFRQNDLEAGGQGAPLVPIFHQALRGGNGGCSVFVNIGGIANVTWCADKDGDDPLSLIAFDTGPGNALLNDWILAHTGESFDRGGEIARKGVVREDVLAGYLRHPYFTQSPPKSLDRGSFSLQACQGLSLEDGAATLSVLSARAIAGARVFYPKQPEVYYLCGGGRHNAYLVETLEHLLAPSVVTTVEALGYQGDFIEAQAFAYLAIRSLQGKALSFPGTTGVCAPMTGGVHLMPQRNNL